jgi:Fe-S-cluster containining protein
VNPCQECGACCSTSAAWPRFSTESDDELDLIPPGLVSDDLSGMRCDGDRCAALIGTVGKRTACSIYGLRPDVCRICVPGDEACSVARNHHRLPPLADRI